MSEDDWKAKKAASIAAQSKLWTLIRNISDRHRFTSQLPLVIGEKNGTRKKTKTF